MVDGNFDLFGHPVRQGLGGRGRPPYEATEKDRNKVKLLLALGWSTTRVANALGVSPATVKRYFRAELKVRDAMRDRLEARRIELAMDLANGGNVGALRELGKLIDRNDLMRAESDMSQRSADADRSAQERADRPGKKEIDALKALDADADLMAELDLEATQNAARH